MVVFPTGTGPRGKSGLGPQSSGHEKNDLTRGRCNGTEAREHQPSPTVLLRISDGACQMKRAFSDFTQAVRAAEAYAGSGSWSP